jgi:3',5'-cyclic-AMP phosphodiesterase
MKLIAFLTDVHLDEQFPLDNNVNPLKNLERAVEDIASRKIEHIVFGGDIGAHTGHQRFFDILKPFSTNLILGNHDKFEEVSPYFNVNVKYDELYYFYDDEKYRFIFLDTSSEKLSHKQLEWLRQKLETNIQVVLFMHHPVIKIDSPVDKLYPLKNRETVQSVLIESGKNITLFCGHYHMYDERTYKNIRQIVTQSLSYQLVKNADEIQIDNTTFGYRIIAFDSDKIETRLVNFIV